MSEAFKSEAEAKQAANKLMAKSGKAVVVVATTGGFVLRDAEQEDAPMSATPPVVRPKRKPLGRQDVLKYPGRPGYVRRVVNDREDRIRRFEEAGYNIVQDADLVPGEKRAGDASQVGAPVSKQVGGGMRAYLMEIPEEWYNEDQAVKQGQVDAYEQEMQRTRGGVDGSYGDMKIASHRR